MLITNTLFGIHDKVQIAIARIREFEPPEGYYVAFSGGKDSITVKDLMQRAGVKYDIHYNLTTVEPPELIYYIRRFHADVEVHRPEETMWQLIPRKRMPPTQVARYCCQILKEGGGVGRYTVTGVRWAESTKRAKRRMLEICNRDSTKIYLHPIIDWTAAEVWEYIRMRQLPYCSLYDEGFARIGCVMCPCGGPKGMQRDARRWPKYAAMYRWACQKAYGQSVADGLTMKKWQSGDDLYNWWISDKRTEKVDPDQTVIFE